MGLQTYDMSRFGIASFARSLRNDSVVVTFYKSAYGSAYDSCYMSSGTYRVCFQLFCDIKPYLGVAHMRHNANNNERLSSWVVTYKVKDAAKAEAVVAAYAMRRELSI